MKILHINCSDIGSTGKIICEISSYIDMFGHQSILCVPTIKATDESYLRKYVTSLPYEQGIYRRLSYLSGILYGFAPVSTIRILSVIKKEEPDIVHLHSINGAMVNIYDLLKFLKKKKILTVITNHAEFFYTGNCSHSEECIKWKTGCGNCPMLRKATKSILFDRTHTAWMKMKNAFYGFDKKKLKIVSVSPWVDERSTISPILKEYEHEIILNGVNTEVFHKDTEVKDFSIISNKKEKILLHVTSNFTDLPNDIKGGRYILQLAEKLKGKDIRIVVVGPYRLSTSVPDNIMLLGNISSQEKLADWYNCAHLTILTSKRETFGMVVAESLCCGTPVVGFKSGGSESIAISTYSEFVEYSDVECLEKVVHDWIGYKTEQTSIQICKDAKQAYDGKLMGRNYLEIYEKMSRISSFK